MLGAGLGDEHVWAPAVFWVLRTETVAVLFDTGAGDPQEVARKRPELRYERPLSEDPIRLLAELGLGVADVSVVLCSHLHWDHSSGNHLFTSARVLVQRSEWRAAHEPPAGHGLAYGSPADSTPPSWYRAAERTELLDGDTEVLPGLRAVHLPGHTPGSQGLMVDCADGPVLLAGDLVPLASNVAEDVVRPPAIASALDDAQASLARATALGARILPSHDAALFGNGRLVVQVGKA